MPSAVMRSRSASSPATASVMRPRARLCRVRLDEEPGVLVDRPEDLVADATVWGSAEEPAIPIDARLEIGYRNTGEEVGDGAQFRGVILGQSAL
jgi:hypothetical protein